MILNFPASKCSEFVCFFLTNFRLVVFIKFVLIKKCITVKKNITGSYLTKKIRFKYASNSLQMLFKFASDAFQIQFKVISNPP